MSRFIFEGDWLWYWLIDSVLVLLYIVALCWLYHQIFKSFNHDKMEVAKSDPQKEIGLNFEELELCTSKGHPIKGWYISSVKESSDKPVIIYSHGFGLSREQLGEVSYRQFDFFIKKGYSVITFEYPIGDREGAHKVSGGVLEAEDLSTVVRFANDKGHQFICLFGYSYGGNTSLYYAVNKVEPLVDAVILDSSIIVTPEIFAKQLEVWMGLPSYISRLFLSLMWKKNIGHHQNNHPIKNVHTEQSDIPILFWHGTHDKDAFYHVMEKISKRQSHTFTQLKTVQDGNHVELHNIVGESAYNQETYDWLGKVRAAR